MIGNPGLIRFASVVTYLNKNTEYEELDMVKHAFLPDRWGIGNKDTGRWVQLAVVNDGTLLEIDYKHESDGHRTMSILDEESAAARILAYIRKEVGSI